MRFTLERGKWYACEFIGDEFNEDKCSYSPIKVHSIEPLHAGNRTFVLNFYHANYPEGVRDKSYTLQTIERGVSIVLARSTDHEPSRFLQIYDITAGWVSRHLRVRIPDASDIQEWLSREA